MASTLSAIDHHTFDSFATVEPSTALIPSGKSAAERFCGRDFQKYAATSVQTSDKAMVSCGGIR